MRAPKTEEIFRPPYLDDTEIVKRWGGKITTKTLANWRSLGKGPPWTNQTGRVTYPLAGIELYESKHRIVPDQKQRS